MDIIKEAVQQLEGDKPAPTGNHDNVTRKPNGAGPGEKDRSSATEFPSKNPRTASELDELRIVHGSMRNEAVYTAFASLRTHMIQRIGKHSCTIMVSGVAERCGTSFVAMNLAASFASDASRSAVLVDCNFAGSRYESLGDSQTVPGITDYIDGIAVPNIDSLMIDIGVPRLRLLAGGRTRSDRREIFTRPRAKQMFAQLCSQNIDRAVIVDAPPASISANASVIAEYCDAVLLVVPYGMTTQVDVSVAARSFPQGKVVGSVFNNIPQWRPNG